MNTKSLTQIFDNYIKRFDWLTAPESEVVDESYKWKDSTVRERCGSTTARGRICGW